MSRVFGTTPDYIVCDVGACGPLGTGAYTMIWLYKLPLFGGAAGLGSLRRSGAYARYALITGNKFFGPGDFSSGFGTAPTNQWAWLVERKAAGSAHYEFAYGNYPISDPNTDITFGEAPDAANHGDPGTGDQVWIGQTDVSGTRTLALQAFFTGRLSDAQIKTALTTQLADIAALSPVGLWPLNQAADTDPVLDVTGGGADQLADPDGIVGTVAVAADPPGYNFSLSVNGTGTAVLGGLIASGVGSRLRLGSGAASLAGLTAAGAGTRTKAGAGVAGLGALTGAGTGVRARSGSGVALLGGLFGAGTGDGASGGPGHAVMTAARPHPAVTASRPLATMEAS